MKLLDIATMNENDLIGVILSLPDDLPADAEIKRALIRERAEALGKSAEFEQYFAAWHEAGTPPEDRPVWDRPEALSAPPPPPFKAEWLPGVFGQYAAALAEFNQVPVDLPALLLLGAVNAAALGLYQVQAVWNEPMQLFVCVSMNPSERKSPVFSAVRRPFDDYTVEENRRRAPLISERRTQRAMAEKALQKAISKGTEEEALRLTSELDALPEIKPLQLIASDATPEAVALMMKDNGGRIVLMDSEGGVFDTMAGRYSNNIPNLDVYLHGFSSENVSVNRVGREPLFLPSASIVAVLAVQPDVVKGVFSNAAMRGRGLVARFLWAQPPSMMGRRRIDVQPVPDGLAQQYSRLICSLLSKARPDTPEPLALTPEAGTAFDKWRLETENRLPGDLQTLASWGWAGKLCGLTLRIAGTLAVMKEARQIDANTLLTAVEISRWAICHAQAVSFGIESNDSAAQRIVDKLTEKGLQLFTRREIHRLIQKQRVFWAAGRFDGAKLDAALKELEERGYIRKAALTSESGLCQWMVNPHVFGDALPDQEEAEEI